jgi:hypothetical protein
MPHLLTVVTATLNSDHSVIETFSSLEPYLSDKVRWIIKDSVEKSSQELKQIANHPNITLINSSDIGLYDALNQAIQFAEFGFTLVLGAGDKFEEGAVNIILELLKNNSNYDCIFFGVKREDTGQVFSPNLDGLSNRMSIPHPGAFMRAEEIIRLGGFNTIYKIASDYDLISRYVLSSKTIGISDYAPVVFKGGGLSDKHAMEGYIEQLLILKRLHNLSDPEILKKIRSDYLNFFL